MPHTQTKVTHCGENSFKFSAKAHLLLSEIESQPRLLCVNSRIKGEMAEFQYIQRPFFAASISDTIEGLLRNSEVEVSKRTVVLCGAIDFGVVIGSTQKISPALHDYSIRHTTPIHRRSSGGSAVIIEPGNSIWIDIFLPPNDPLASTSIEKTFEVASVGWTAVLASFGVVAETYRGSYSLKSGYREICFAGRAHGEILVDQKKVVGMAQRRRRIGTYIHTMAYIDFPFLETIEATYGLKTDPIELESLGLDLSTWQSQGRVAPIYRR